MNNILLSQTHDNWTQGQENLLLHGAHKIQ